MSFDKNHESPDKLVNPAKRTTKVNIVVAIAVLAFFAIGAAIFFIVKHNPPKSPDPVEITR